MEGLNLDNAAQFHVWQHLIQLGEVETKVYYEGKRIMFAPIGGAPRAPYRFRDQFYVDPKNGVLRLLKAEPRKRPGGWRGKPVSIESIRRTTPGDHLTQYFLIEEKWYRVSLREPTEEETKRKSFFFFFFEGMDPRSFKMVVERHIIMSNKIVGCIYMVAGMYIQRILWHMCEALFGGPYLPTEITLVGAKAMKKVENALKRKDK